MPSVEDFECPCIAVLECLAIIYRNVRHNNVYRGLRSGFARFDAAGSSLIIADEVGKGEGNY